MFIYELAPGQEIKIMVTVSEQTLEFQSTIEEVYPKKKIAFASPVYVDDKLLTFRGQNLLLDVVFSIEGESTPQIFKNVNVTPLKKPDGSICYSLHVSTESRTFNRRGSFRCPLGISTTVQCGMHRVPYDTIVKDVSATGFSFILPKTTQVDRQNVIHIVINDYIEEIYEEFNFNLYGLIVRSYDLDEKRVVYGCRLLRHVPGLEKYLTTKERLRLRKTHGLH